MQFVLNHWYLFVALVVVLVLLVAPIVMQHAHGIKSLTPAQSVLLINRESAVVIDVSEPAEYKRGHVAGAISAPLASFEQSLAQLDKYKSRPVLVVGRTVNQALKAAARLRRRGFASVSVLAGGMLAWERENLPLEKA